MRSHIKLKFLQIGVIVLIGWLYHSSWNTIVICPQSRKITELGIEKFLKMSGTFEKSLFRDVVLIPKILVPKIHINSNISSPWLRLLSI